MPSKIDIPRKSIYRLSIYQRCLSRLKENGVETVSSDALAKAAGVKSTQLRKDLTYFGQFGTRGLGYNVSQLSRTIGDVLGHNRLQPVILVGNAAGVVAPVFQSLQPLDENTNHILGGDPADDSAHVESSVNSLKTVKVIVVKPLRNVCSKSILLRNIISS